VSRKKRAASEEPVMSCFDWAAACALMAAGISAAMMWAQ
jgi:hypothetical protein